ncbi:MAG: flagellar assembly protein T N-terminal domain-containing protein [Deltaproteobacteria bacterium]|nr:flagellar assembly protein T N-terminal domain-containing protein [Deltaproteobacteria bacterium]
MRCSYRILLLVFLLSLLPQNVLSQSSTIESQGVAAIVQGNLDISRDKAIEDALRNAVEQATGSLIENETLVENYQLLSDKIYSQSKGYVQSYEVLSEKAEEGLYRVTIQATVASGDLKNDLRALNILMHQVRKPRVMVLFEETLSQDVNIGRLAEDAVSKVLLERGFKLVDADVVRRNLGREGVRGLLAGDQRVAAVIGDKYGAEMLLIGTAQATTSEVTIGDIRINSNQAVISAKLVRADTGEVKVSETRQAAKPHVNSLTGKQMAIAEASEYLANDMIDRMIEIFQEQVYNIANVNLTIYGLQGYAQLQEVIQLISDNVRGIKEIYQRNYTMGTADLEVELTGSTQSLAADLTTRTFGKYKFDIKESTHNQLQVIITPANR